MPKAKQVTAWVESKPGELGRIAEALAKAKVNITAISGWSLTGESPVHLLVSSPAKAKKALAGLGIRCTEEDVLCITVSNEPEGSRRSERGWAVRTLTWIMAMEALRKAVRRLISCLPSLTSPAPQRPCAGCRPIECRDALLPPWGNHAGCHYSLSY